MKKPLVLAALSGLVLIGATHPDIQRLGYGDRGYEDSAGGRTYRPCRSRRDDNCIQLYERGVRAAYARWLRNGDPGYDEAVRYAAADARRYGRHGRHDHGRDDARRAHRNHFAGDGHHGRDDAHRGHHRRDGHAEHGALQRDRHDHAGHGQGRGGPRFAMRDMRCEHGAAPPRTMRPPQARPSQGRPEPRPRLRTYIDGDVHGM